MNSFLRCLFIFSAFSLSKCSSSGNAKGKIVIYQMISYESKAEVIQADFPTIKIFNDSNFEIYKRNQLVDNGSVGYKNDSMFFKLQNGMQLYGVALNNSQKILRVGRLININIEAKWGNFLRVE